MSGWDEGAVYYSDQAQFPRGGGGAGDPELAASRHTVLRKVKEFIRNFAHQNQPNVIPYRESLVQNPKFLLVNLSDLLNYDKDQDLRDLLRKNPSDYLPLAQYISKLVKISGITIAASRTKAKATYVTLLCKNCKNVKVIPCRPGLGGAIVPGSCDHMPQGGEEPCAIDPWIVVPDKSKYVDQQTLKLQENPEFLKFVEKTAPVAVYTSGKGSSAAGLTASVIRDNSSREFYLEGGAMVLADGGVVCIDEFDKMRAEDRVAIHEAMEQQTISIAKAGITTVLNSRTSVLAAANPPSGRYDDLKTVQDNIDLQTTILSRFDLIFIVKDIRMYSQDKDIASHIIKVHASGNAATGSRRTSKEDDWLKRYIQYCRTVCHPHLSDFAATLLQESYDKIRQSCRI